MYKSGLVLALLGAASMSTMAADQGHGKVNFVGEIVSAPCSISPESVDQTVDLGQISNVELANSGSSPVKNFTIELQDCDFSTKENETSTWPHQAISITFSGAQAGTSELLGLTGFSGPDADKANNVGIQINDPSNTPVKMGTQLEDVVAKLQDGNNTLLFSSFVKTIKANAEVGDIPLGQFKAVTNFTIAYN